MERHVEVVCFGAFRPGGTTDVRDCLSCSHQSTLLRVCAGMLRADAGRLFVDEPRAFVFQNPDHQVVMPSVGADVAFGLGRFNLPPHEITRRVDEALAAVNLQASRGRNSHASTLVHG